MKKMENPSTSSKETPKSSHPLKSVSVRLERLSLAQINALRASIKLSSQDLSIPEGHSIDCKITESEEKPNEQELCKEKRKRKHSKKSKEEKTHHEKSRKVDKHVKERRDSEKSTVPADTVQNDSDAGDAIVHYGEVEYPQEKQAGDGDDAKKENTHDGEVKSLSREKSESGVETGARSRDVNDVNNVKSEEHSKTESSSVKDSGSEGENDVQNSETNERITQDSESDKGSDEALKSKTVSKLRKLKKGKGDRSSKTSKSEIKSMKNIKKKHNYDSVDTGSEAGSSDHGDSEKEHDAVKSEESGSGEDSGSEGENFTRNSETNERTTQDSESDEDSDVVSKIKKSKKGKSSKSSEEMKISSKKQKLLKMVDDNRKKQRVTKASADSSSTKKEGWLANKSASAWDSLEKKLQLFMKMEAMQRKVEVETCTKKPPAFDLSKIGKIKKKTNNTDDKRDSRLTSPVVSSTWSREDKWSSDRNRYKDRESSWTSGYNRRPGGDGKRMDGRGRFRSNDNDRRWNQGRPGHGRQDDTRRNVRDHKREGSGKSEINKFTAKDRNSHHFDTQLQKSGDSVSGRLSQDEEDAGWFDAWGGDHDDDSDYERSGQETSLTGIEYKKPNNQEHQMSKGRRDVFKHQRDHSSENQRDRSSKLPRDQGPKHHRDHGFDRHHDHRLERGFDHRSENRGHGSEHLSHQHIHNSEHYSDHSSEHSHYRSGSGHPHQDRSGSSSNRRSDDSRVEREKHNYKQRDSVNMVDDRAYQGEGHHHDPRGRVGGSEPHKQKTVEGNRRSRSPKDEPSSSVVDPEENLLIKVRCIDDIISKMQISDLKAEELRNILLNHILHNPQLKPEKLNSLVTATLALLNMGDYIEESSSSLMGGDQPDSHLTEDMHYMAASLQQQSDEGCEEKPPGGSSVWSGDSTDEVVYEAELGSKDTEKSQGGSRSFIHQAENLENSSGSDDDHMTAYQTDIHLRRSHKQWKKKPSCRDRQQFSIGFEDENSYSPTERRGEDRDHLQTMYSSHSEPPRMASGGNPLPLMSMDINPTQMGDGCGIPQQEMMDVGMGNPQQQMMGVGMGNPQQQLGVGIGNPLHQVGGIGFSAPKLLNDSINFADMLQTINSQNMKFGMNMPGNNQNLGNQMSGAIQEMLSGVNSDTVQQALDILQNSGPELLSQLRQASMGGGGIGGMMNQPDW